LVERLPYKGKQYYAGSTQEAANRKLLEIVGTGNSNGPHSIKDAVKEYLDSIEGIQSSDSVNTKRRTYNRVMRSSPRSGGWGCIKPGSCPLPKTGCRSV
jgi:hypothetical protein